MNILFCMHLFRGLIRFFYLLSLFVLTKLVEAYISLYFTGLFLYKANLVRKAFDKYGLICLFE